MKRLMPLWLSLVVLAGAVMVRVQDPTVAVTLRHAVFDAPADQPDHAQLAFECTLEMDVFAQAFASARKAEGYPLGMTRIGVHTGSVVVGNMGGDVLFNYCAHGDAINTAARLETVNKHLGTRICISGDTVSRCTHFTGRPVGSLVLKGKSGGLRNALT